MLFNHVAFSRAEKFAINRERRVWVVCNFSLGCERGACFSRSLNAVDFFQFHDALASNSYDKIVDIYDELMLQMASKGVDF